MMVGRWPAAVLPGRRSDCQPDEDRTTAARSAGPCQLAHRRWSAGHRVMRITCTASAMRSSRPSRCVPARRRRGSRARRRGARARSPPATPPAGRPGERAGTTRSPRRRDVVERHPPRERPRLPVRPGPPPGAAPAPPRARRSRLPRPSPTCAASARSAASVRRWGSSSSAVTHARSCSSTAEAAALTLVSSPSSRPSSAPARVLLEAGGGDRLLSVSGLDTPPSAPLRRRPGASSVISVTSALGFVVRLPLGLGGGQPLAALPRAAPDAAPPGRPPPALRTASTAASTAAWASSRCGMSSARSASSAARRPRPPSPPAAAPRPPPRARRRSSTFAAQRHPGRVEGFLQSLGGGPTGVLGHAERPEGIARGPPARPARAGAPGLARPGDGAARSASARASSASVSACSDCQAVLRAGQLLAGARRGPPPSLGPRGAGSTPSCSPSRTLNPSSSRTVCSSARSTSTRRWARAPGEAAVGFVEGVEQVGVERARVGRRCLGRAPGCGRPARPRAAPARHRPGGSEHRTPPRRTTPRRRPAVREASSASSSSASSSASGTGTSCCVSAARRSASASATASSSVGPRATSSLSISSSRAATRARRSSGDSATRRRALRRLVPRPGVPRPPAPPSPLPPRGPAPPRHRRPGPPPRGRARRRACSSGRRQRRHRAIAASLAAADVSGVRLHLGPSGRVLLDLDASCRHRILEATALASTTRSRSAVSASTDSMRLDASAWASWSACRARSWAAVAAASAAWARSSSSVAVASAVHRLGQRPLKGQALAGARIGRCRGQVVGHHHRVEAAHLAPRAGRASSGTRSKSTPVGLQQPVGPPRPRRGPGPARPRSAAGGRRPPDPSPR